MRKPVLGYAFLVLLTALGLSAAVGLATSFLEPFTGSPSSPTPGAFADVDVVVHQRDYSAWTTMPEMDAGHGSDCSAPPSTHHLNGTYPDAFFQCRDHVMTAINSAGYAVIYMTPNQLLDFSQGEAVLDFEMSTLRTSPRDWIDIWLTPFADQLVEPLEPSLPDLAGFPQNTIRFRMTGGAGASGMFSAGRADNGVIGSVPYSCCLDWKNFLTPSASVRTPMQLRLSTTHAKFGFLAPSGVWKWYVDANLSPALPFNQAVVQIGHHSYSPDKDCQPGYTCAPDTWHWDNLALNPAVPLTLLKPDRQRVLGTDANKTVTLPSPAPANAYLRFGAVGTITVSYDGGPFVAATQQPVIPGSGNAAHVYNYLTAVPQGTTTITFAFAPRVWYTGPYLADGISVVAQ